MERAHWHAGQQPGLGPDRVNLIVKAAESWTKDLLDRSGRNPLLYYRNLRRGTLDLTAGTDVTEKTRSELLSGRKTRLSRLFNHPDQLKDAARRARTIAAKAQMNDEERGVQTLFLAWGLANWTDSRTSGPGSSSIPAAPLFITPLALDARGGVAEDFNLQISDEWQLNPTLIHHLESQYQFTLEIEEDKDIDLSSEEYRIRLANRITQQAKPDVPGFNINNTRTVIGNFSYQKLAMVKDIEGAKDNGLLLQHDLLAAIAGDTKAQEKIRGQHINFNLGPPDQVHPSKEYLVLDADASQSNVINTVVAERDLVVEGPPGTGKSQTIANLIATLVANQKWVLFVAEKRAAIDAVLKRLQNVDLDNIVLDLHETGAKSIRRRVASDLQATFENYTNSLNPNVDSIHNDLHKHRTNLNKFTEAIHQKRHPWGISFYDIQTNLITLRGKVKRSNLRITGKSLNFLAGDRWEASLNNIRRFVDLEGLRLITDSNSWGSPWNSAYLEETITSREQIEMSLEALRYLDLEIDITFQQFKLFIAACGLRPLNTLSQWRHLVELLKDVESVHDNTDPAIYEVDQDALYLFSERPKGFKFSTWLMSHQYRQAIKELKKHWTNNNIQPTRRELHQLGRKVALHLAKWRKLTTSDKKPQRPPNDLPNRANEVKIYVNLDKIESAIQATGDPVLPYLTIDQQQKRVAKLLEDQEILFNLVDIKVLDKKLTTRGLKPIILEATRRQLNTDKTVDLASYIWHESLLDRLRHEDLLVRSFKGGILARTVKEYKEVDRYHIESGRERVRRQVAEWSIKVRNKYPEESLLVQKQAKLKTRHMPVRRLLKEAPHVLRALKPCWAMSPLLAAEILPQSQLFDVVIFDEASQITAADAIGPIMRANRVVVTGDTKQLPPTKFFLGSTEDEDEEEEPEESLTLTSGFESILDVMATLLAPPHGTRHLKWHYRSLNEQLIAFSNAQPSLYNGSLTTFPGISNDDCINHILTEYDPGGTGKQVKEAARVVDLIFEHAQKRPDESLGVITMGIKHAELIEEHLRQSREHHPEIDHWLDHGPDHLSDSEALFIKNIERVQGDERDAIILSIGYGRGANGKMVHRFGPLNMEGGERRLNVAVTRARRRMTMVSSFTSADLDPHKLRAEGAKMLRGYLAYAETYGRDLGIVRADSIPLNPFELDIQKGLREAGIPLTAQYGSAGYWIDFVAAHPERPGQMVLAIEADGARYHSSETARDRDRLRQEHLERIGWRFHRIWSTDWFLHREREIERAFAAWKSAVADADCSRQSITSDPSKRNGPVFGQPTPALRKGPRPVEQGFQINKYQPHELVALIRWINSDGLLRTNQELLDIAVKELGFSKKGNRIVEALNKAIEKA